MRRRDAIKTDQLKLELMRAKAGEINTFLQKQILEKQSRQEQERTRRINTPDVFARTGYPPVNSPSRDLKAMEVALPITALCSSCSGFSLNKPHTIVKKDRPWKKRRFVMLFTFSKLLG